MTKTIAPPYLQITPDERAYCTHLSFLKFIRTNRGKLLRTEAFYVPNQDYLKGRITGHQAFAELLDEAKRTGFVTMLPELLKEVCKALEEPAQNSRRGAAVAFVCGIERALSFMAQYCEYQKWTERQIKEILVVEEIERDRRKRQTIAARQAKQAKKAKDNNFLTKCARARG